MIERAKSRGGPGASGADLFPEGATMIKTQVGLAAALFASIVLSGPKPLWGADAPVDATLKSHGLKRAGDLYVLVTESDVKNKVQEIRRLSKQLSYALMQQQGTLSAKDYQDTIKGLGDQINQYKSEINTVNQQMNALPRFRGRLANNYATEQYQELQVYRNQLQAEFNQGTLFLNQLRSRPFDPKAKEKVDADVQDRRESYHQALLDLRQLVDAAQKKYAEITKNDDVQKALETVNTGAKTKLKLGPSREFTTDVKLLEKLEREEAGEHAPQPEPKPGRTTKRSVRGKRASKPASSTPAPSSTPEAAGRF
jgi:hypothetical protein